MEYRPNKLEIKFIENGFKVVDSENDNNQLATIFEFNIINSDLPYDEVKEFAELIIGVYNEAMKE